MEKLAELRKQIGKTQQGIADILGVARATVAKWETGEREPDIKTLKTLAAYYHTSVSYIVGETENGAPISDKKADVTIPKEARLLSLYRDTAPEIRAAVDKLLETYAWTMSKAKDINGKGG